MAAFVLTGQDAVEEARLIGLGTGSVLVVGAGMPLGAGIESLDVADQVPASGAVRPGDPPLITMGVLMSGGLTVTGSSIAVLLCLLLWWPAAVVRGREGN
ncbi:hypothetical protein [Actinoplanes sp. G11-F43]|uniref:hypothetical protein n=1 Tax=Actinoplanes sp. G11-F43 TaxID=3424130 RepID=UPI003D34F620